jgi:AraC family transcriptional regulator of adaptative response / DNA-3-methyladenine glycosylase II
MPAARSEALLRLARALADGTLSVHAGVDRAKTLEQLRSLRGIGPWTASYIAMRGLRDPDAFLPTDLGVRHALERLGHDGRPVAAERLAEHWRPYRAYAVQHLWAQLPASRPTIPRRGRNRLAA